MKKAEIDNAIYDDNTLSAIFKNYFEENNDELNIINKIFFAPTSNSLVKDVPVEQVMTFIRKNLVLPMTPISYYARGTGRTDLLSKLFEKLSDDNINNENDLLKSFIDKIHFLNSVNDYSFNKNLRINRLALETFLWMFGILDQEDEKYEFSESLKIDISSILS